MASNINSAAVDAQYPVAGRDNDTQGFRDNFSTIKNSLAAAKEEIEDLQSKAVLKDALTDSEINNNLAGSSIIDANLEETTFNANLGPTYSESQQIFFSTGHYQTFIVADDLTITLTGWPAESRYASLRLEITPDGTGEKQITFQNQSGLLKTDGNSGWNGANYILTDNAAENPAQTILEFWTADGGATVFARYLGQFA